MTGESVFGLQEDAETSARAFRRLAGPVFSALQHSMIAMVATDPRMADNPIIFANAAFQAMTGHKAEELLGRNCRILQGPATDHHVVRAIAAAIAAEGCIEAEILNYRKDGSEFWNRICIVPVPDESGLMAFFLSWQLDITADRYATLAEAERQTREGRLKAVNESLQNVLAISGAAATWEWQIADQKLFGDASFAALYGLSPEVMEAGVPANIFFSRIHPRDLARTRLAVGGMLRGAELFSREFRIIEPGGATRWVHGRGRCTFDENDRPARFSGVLVDITEQKRLEEKLRIAQSAGGVGTFEHIEGFATVSVSPQFCMLLGLHPAADLPVRTLNAVVHPGDPAIIDMSANDGNAARHIEFRITRPDNGEQRWLARRGEHLRDTEGAGNRFSGVIYDITQSKRTEAQLRAFNETLEVRVAETTRERDRIWRVSPDLLGVADANGRWQSINPAWKTLLGWDEADILGKDCGWLHHPDDTEGTTGAFVRAAQSGEKFTLSNRLRRRNDGYRWLSWTAVPDHGLIYCVGRDVTAERETAEALRHAEDMLRQSQKMEAVGQLTGGLAHDFNNLLTGITGSLALLKTRLARGRLQEVDKYLTAAQGAARRAASLTHRLLAFSRQQTLDPRHTNVNRLVLDMEELIRRTVGPSVTLEIIAGIALWPCLVDANQLENALLNLCINARDAMPDGGRLLIATENISLEQAGARALDLPAAEFVTLSVSDNGTGMPPDVVARAFDPFFTTKPLGQGTGLGLSMIYGFARQSGGQVRIKSMVGRGTTVSLYLPRHFGAGDEVAKQSTVQLASRAGQGETVLVVDDEATVRMLVTDVLHDLGYTAMEASDGREGLAVLQSDARIDLLVTDVGLPGGMNGRQVADMGRALRPDLKVMFITGYAENAVLSSGDLDRDMHVLTKPFLIEVLADRIRQIIGS